MPAAAKKGGGGRAPAARAVAAAPGGACAGVAAKKPGLLDDGGAAGGGCALKSGTIGSVALSGGLTWYTPPGACMCLEEVDEDEDEDEDEEKGGARWGSAWAWAWPRLRMWLRLLLWLTDDACSWSYDSVDRLGVPMPDPSPQPCCHRLKRPPKSAVGVTARSSKSWLWLCALAGCGLGYPSAGGMKRLGGHARPSPWRAAVSPPHPPPTPLMNAPAPNGGPPVPMPIVAGLKEAVRLSVGWMICADAACRIASAAPRAAAAGGDATMAAADGRRSGDGCVALRTSAARGSDRSVSGGASPARRRCHSGPSVGNTDCCVTSWVRVWEGKEYGGVNEGMNSGTRYAGCFKGVSRAYQIAMLGCNAKFVQRQAQ